ncbi:MAG: hemolysin family protein [Elusimicrobiota bacterium]
MFYIIGFIIVALLIFFSFFFSLTETSLIGLDKAKLSKLIAQNKSAFVLWRDHPNRVLAAILIGNNIVNIAAASLVTAIAIKYALSQNWRNDNFVFVSTIILTLILIVFAEITPKILAKQHTEAIARWIIRPVVFVTYLLSPLIRILIFIVTPLVKLFGGKLTRESPFVLVEDIRMLADVGVQQGTLGKEEKEMIHSALDFGDTFVEEVMTRREKVISLNIEMEKEKFIDLAVEAGYSRLPVYRGSLDNILGILYTRDLLNTLRYGVLFTIEDLLRPAYFVQGHTKINTIFRQFKKGEQHIAIVKDSHKKVVGLITVHDLIEEIVGDIMDEYRLIRKKKKEK